MRTALLALLAFVVGFGAVMGVGYGLRFLLVAYQHGGLF